MKIDTKLNPKALEAALKAAESKKGLVSHFGQQEAYHQYGEKAIQTYIEHPAVDLVPRSEIRKGWQELMDERDEARREAARQTLLQEMRATECEGLGKQIASLREVALAVIVETKFSVRPANGEPIVEIINKHGPAHRRLCAALTDTAKAAAQ